MIKILEDLDVRLLLDCYKDIEKHIQWSEYANGKQTGIQYRKGNDPWVDAVGRAKLNDDWTSDVILNEHFIGTEFENIIKKYNITRTRLMWLKPYSCYSMHKDDSARLHIPLITNTNCYFVLKEEGLFHMETGHAYWADTRKEHSAMNCSTQWRLHLLGSFCS
jgi:hypothetical protein